MSLEINENEINEVAAEIEILPFMIDEGKDPDSCFNCDILSKVHNNKTYGCAIFKDVAKRYHNAGKKLDESEFLCKFHEEEVIGTSSTETSYEDTN